MGSTSFGLNNNGDTLSLFYDDLGERVSFDELAYTSDWVEAGVAIQLSADKINATDNDDLNNWCLATTEIESTMDLGSPGVANMECPVME